MRLQLMSVLALLAIGCGPPNAGITFDEPASGPPFDATTDSGESGGAATEGSSFMTSSGEPEDGFDPSSTSGPGETTETSSDGNDGTTGIPLPDPVTMVEWTFGTTTYAGQFAPHNIVAVWIEDDQGTFVRTLLMLSEIEKIHLVEWNLVSGGNTFDAVTGASPHDHGTTHAGVWNLQDAMEAIVADGDYVLRIEMTEDNSAGPPPEGPLRTIPFTLGDGHFDIQPADGEIFHSVRVYGHD
jgi:hypothetical protein